MKTLATLFVSLLLLSSAALAQEKSGMVKTEKGVLVVWNEPGNYYTIEIRGQNISPASQPLLFQVDGKFFQIQVVDQRAFLSGKDSKSLDDKTILAAHRDWEGDYISGIIKKKLQIDSEWFKLANGKDALGWSYDMPRDRIPSGSQARKQFYLSVVKGNMVFLLNSALTGDDTDSDKAMRQLLIDTMNTLKPSDKPLSLANAAEMVKKGT